MTHAADQVFAWLCGRAPGHVWAPGGDFLPFCQRCTGLYVGACLALLCHALFRPRPGKRSARIYTLCLLQMAPFGFHWIEQNGPIRTLTGMVFSFGLVGLLGLLPRAWWKPRTPSARQPGTERVGRCLATFAAFTPLVILSAAYGGQWAGLALTATALVGCAGLALLAGANLVLLAWHVPPRARSDAQKVAP